MGPHPDKKKEERESSLSMRTAERPCEHTAGRQLSAHRKGFSLEPGQPGTLLLNLKPSEL